MGRKQAPWWDRREAPSPPLPSPHRERPAEGTSGPLRRPDSRDGPGQRICAGNPGPFPEAAGSPSLRCRKGWKKDFLPAPLQSYHLPGFWKWLESSGPRLLSFHRKRRRLQASISRNRYRFPLPPRQTHTPGCHDRGFLQRFFFLLQVFLHKRR